MLRILPAAVPRPALALAAVAFALFAIARTTGSGWLIVVLTSIATVAALGSALPAFGLRRLRLAAEAPRDATVGRGIELVIELSGRGNRPVKVRPLGSFEADWTGAFLPCRGRLTAIPLQRGVVDRVELEVRSAGPLGLMWWRRRIAASLARPIEVGPQPLDVGLRRAGARDQGGRHPGQTVSAISDVVKTVREYHVGDPIKLVHWAATARAGELMVKELESPMGPALVIAVELRRANPDDVETAAARAAGLALTALQSGIPVVLLTAEASGPRSGPVNSPVDVSRRLARAVPGELPAAPRGVEPVVVAAAPTAHAGQTR